jgi:hypothetical protein
MKDQIQAIYDIASYLDDKCPSCGTFFYVWGMDPYIQLRGIDADMAVTVLRPQLEEIAKPVNLEVTVRFIPPSQEDSFPSTCVVISSALLVWESIFPVSHEVPPEAPMEWFMRQLQEQLFPRVTGATDDLT